MENSQTTKKSYPKRLQHNLQFPKLKLLEGIKVINSVTNDVKLTFKTNEILFESLSQDNSEAKTQIEINLGIQEEIEIGINSRHVLDFLMQIDTADFVWGLNGKNAPFVLKVKTSLLL